MRRLMSWCVGAIVLAGFCGEGRAAIEYHFMPGLGGQPHGDAQFLEVAPVSGADYFCVVLSGSTIGCFPSWDEASARAYLDKWGLGVLNPDAGLDTGLVGQVLLDGQNGGEYLRLEFADPVRLNYLTFASVGLADTFELSADDNPIDLQVIFPGLSTIREISAAQGNWPGKVDFTLGAAPLPYAKVWDVAVSSASLGSGIQLENLGVDLLPEPSTLALWAVGAGVGAVVLRRRRARR